MPDVLSGCSACKRAPCSDASPGAASLLSVALRQPQELDQTRRISLAGSATPLEGFRCRD